MKKKEFSFFLPLAVICIFTLFIFFKIFLKGLYPIPADLLVSFYFPWYSGGWEGYNPWTTHKELLNADAIRQIYLWKEFAISQFKNGQFPLWNPYTFSGQPLLANFQSSVFFPLNLLYFLTSTQNTWILLVVIQPLLGGIFMYLALRSFRLSSVASLFGSTAFMFSSYLVTWMENVNIAHSYIWLPLSFWAINNYFEGEQPAGKWRYVLILILSLTLSTLAGHPQTAIYLSLAKFIYWLFKSANKRVFANLFIYIISVLTSLLLGAIQLVPTYGFYKNSPISLPFSKEVFERSIIPFKNLITFFASDFFGHPANNNFWSQSYGDFTPYFGVIPLVFALWAIVKLWKVSFTKFAAFTSAFFILVAVHGPITYLIKTLKIPLLDATTPSRFISISIFLLVILAAFGFEDFVKNFQNKTYLKKISKFLMLLGVIYALLWLFAILGKFFLKPQEIWQTNLSVTRRNLILPTLMFVSIPLIVTMIQIIVTKIKLSNNMLKIFLVSSMFMVMLVGGIYYTNKFLPVAPKQFIFPDHMLFDWLRDNSGLYRFYGAGTTHIDFNFPTHYQVYGIEGYDTLRNKRYAELLASSFNGSVPSSYLRSDGVVPNEENGYRKRIFDLLGVKYLLDKEDNPKTDSDWHYEHFPNDNVTGVWQEEKFQVYERRPVLPRIFLTTNYLIAKNDQEIIQKIYDPSFNLETLILEQEPPIKIEKENLPIVQPKIINYEPNEISIATNLDYNSLLFISDTYDQDWNVYIDGQKSELMRTHYAFRSVAVPQNHHQVEFKYQPKSFILGAGLSALSIIILIIMTAYTIRKKVF